MKDLLQKKKELAKLRVAAWRAAQGSDGKKTKNSPNSGNPSGSRDSLESECNLSLEELKKLKN